MGVVTPHRAQQGLIVLVTQEVVDHLASDLDVLGESRLVKSYVESFCKTSRPMTLGYLEAGAEKHVGGLFKWR